MNNLILFLCLILGTGVSGSGQRNPQAAPTPSPEDVQRQQRKQSQEDLNRRAQELRSIEKFPVKAAADSDIFRKYISPLYREPDKTELRKLAPDTEDFDKFSGFLRQPRTGLIKLVPEKNCGDEKITSAAPDCLQYPIPGAGSSYSFRVGNYRIQRLADLNFTGRSFRSFGVLTHGILVSLGDAPLEQIDLQSAAVISLLKFQPAADFKEAQDLALRLDAGVRSNEFVYRNILPATVGATYVVRSIAYKGSSIRTVQSVSYDELELDKRKDVIVAFRIVRRADDGSVTLLWKELVSKTAPKLKEIKEE